MRKILHWTLVSLSAGLPAVTRSQGITVSGNKCLDGRTRNFYWYVPSGYMKGKQYPLLVFLHDGVDGSYPDNLKTAYPGNILLHLSERTNSILLCPVGDGGATWFDTIGIANVFDQVLLTAKRYSVDRDRIFLSGFGDGGSAAVHTALTRPDLFAGYLSFSGDPLKGFRMSGSALHLMNASNVSLYMVSTGRDEMASADEAGRFADLLRKAGGNVTFVLHDEMEKTLFYLGLELPGIDNFLRTHTRVVFPDTVYWEVSDTRFGKFKWISVDRIYPGEYSNHQTNAAGEWDRDPSRFLSGDLPSARVAARFSDNEFHIEQKGVGMVTVYIHPEMVNMDQPVSVFVNNRLLFNGKVERDRKFARDFYRKFRDDMQKYYNRIILDLREEI